MRIVKMSDELEESSEEEEFREKHVEHCISDLEAYKIKKERDAYWKQVQQLRAELERLKNGK